MMDPIKVNKYYSLMKKKLYEEAKILAIEINSERSPEEIEMHDGITRMNKKVRKNGYVWRPRLFRGTWLVNKCFRCDRRFQGKPFCPRCSYEDKNPGSKSYDGNMVEII